MTKQFTKYDQSEVQVFTILDQPEPCARCGRDTLIIFPGKMCSRCTGVWTPAERAGTLAAIRRLVPLTDEDLMAMLQNSLTAIQSRKPDPTVLDQVRIPK
jgi:hypothetical protein